MRRFLIVSSLSGSLIIFAHVTALYEKVLLFVLFGILPGSETPLEANAMLVIWSLLFIAVSRRWIMKIARKVYAKALLIRLDQPA